VFVSCLFIKANKILDTELKYQLKDHILGLFIKGAKPHLT